MVQTDTPSPHSFFSTRAYRLFWVSSLFSNIGTWMQQIAQPWVLLSLSSSAFWVGLDGFAMNAPSLLFTLWGGVIADRYDRKKIVLFFQGIQFLCVLTMVVFLIVGWLKVWIIVLISFLIGLTDSLSMPSFQSIIPSLVSAKEIHRAVSLNSTQFNLSRILGPAIAGILIVRFGVISCFSANAASYIPFFLSLYFIYPRNRKVIQQPPKQASPVTELSQFRVLLKKPSVLLPLLTTFCTNIFCAPLLTFCAVLVKSVFHGEAANFGNAMVAFGIGGLIGASSSFISLPLWIKRNRMASLLAVLLAVTVIGVSYNHSLVLLIGLLICAGALLTSSNISVNTFLQENASNAIRGRIASLYQLALSGGLSAGALITGFMVSKFGISAALAANGVLAFAIQSWILWRQFRNSGVNIGS
jgi:predicted MFS family arabinose efflux permease